MTKQEIFKAIKKDIESLSHTRLIDYLEVLKNDPSIEFSKRKMRLVEKQIKHIELLKRTIGLKQGGMLQISDNPSVKVGDRIVIPFQFNSKRTVTVIRVGLEY